MIYSCKFNSIDIVGNKLHCLVRNTTPMVVPNVFQNFSYLFGNTRFYVSAKHKKDPCCWVFAEKRTNCIETARVQRKSSWITLFNEIS